MFICLTLFVCLSLSMSLSLLVCKCVPSAGCSVIRDSTAPMYIYICTCTHNYIHVPIYTYLHVYIYARSTYVGESICVLEALARFVLSSRAPHWLLVFFQYWDTESWSEQSSHMASVHHAPIPLLTFTMQSWYSFRVSWLICCFGTTSPVYFHMYIPVLYHSLWYCTPWYWRTISNLKTAQFQWKEPSSSPKVDHKGRNV